MISIVIAGAVSLLVAAFGTPFLIRTLRAHGIGQQIREDGPAFHIVKAGTPTMGGIAVIVSTVIGYLFGHLGTSARFTAAGALVLGATALAGAIGGADDWLKVSRQRSLGLNKSAKFGLQVVVGVLFALAAEHWSHVATTLSFTRATVPGLALGAAGWVVWAAFIMTAESNAVNLTDGLDGLAAGSAAFCFGGLALIGYWQYRHPHIYHVHAALDLAIVGSALAGACIGFLWWNAAPAHIFMGDTGSLAIGTGLACLVLEMDLQLLLLIIGGLFLIVTLSVVAQVISFRVFHTRVLLMAPIHHHFELVGWPETTVIVRFWIISSLCTALGLGIFYADFLGVRSLL